MSTIKCFNCGITNWAAAETCVKCKNKLENYEYESANYSRMQSSPAWKTDYPTTSKPTAVAGFLPSIVMIGLVFVGILCVYFVCLKPAFRKPGAIASTYSPEPAVTEIAVALPPAGMNVAPPDVLSFETLTQAQINQNNSIRFGKKSSDSQIVDEPIDMSRPNHRKLVIDEARRRLGPCDPTVNNCRALLNERIDGVIEESNRLLYAKLRSRTVVCSPKIQGEVKLGEPGQYYKYDDEVYYVTKIRADGMEVFEQNNECAYKRSFGLTAHIYLKWERGADGPGGWRPSDPTEFSSAAKAYREREKERRNEAIGKALEQKRIAIDEANRKMRNQNSGGY